MIDFATLKRSVSIANVLSAYGVSLPPHGREGLIGICPLQGGDNPTAFRVNLSRGLWYCFTHCGGGHLLDLVARLEGDGASLYQAALKLQQLGPSLHRGPKAQSESTVHSQRQRELPFRLQLTPHPYLTVVRGLTQITCQHFGLGMCDRGVLAGRIAIPIHDRDGRLVAYAGRSPQVCPDKYRLPGGFRKGEVLFNAWHQAARASSTSSVCTKTATPTRSP